MTIQEVPDSFNICGNRQKYKFFITNLSAALIRQTVVFYGNLATKSYSFIRMASVVYILDEYLRK